MASTTADSNMAIDDDEVVRIFSKFDKNGDGKISSGELRDVLAALGSSATDDEVCRVMAELDRDGDGFVDLEEFRAFHCGAAGDKELRDAFDLYDQDGNGLISAQELHSFLAKLGDKCSIADCNKMIANVDKDGDGFVNFDEFKKMMNKDM